MIGYILAGVFAALAVTFFVSCIVAFANPWGRYNAKAERTAALSGLAVLVGVFIVGVFGLAHNAANPPKCECGCKCEVKR